MGEYLNDCVELLRFSLTWVRDRSIRGLFLVIAVLAVLQMGFGMVQKSLGLAFISPLFSITFALLYAYYGAKVILLALKARGLGNSEYNLEKFGKFFALGILNFLTALFPWTETRLLVLNIVLGVAALLSLVLAFVSSKMFFVLAVIAGCAWLLSVAYCGMRLFFSCYIYLSGRTGVMGSVRESWKMTNGKIIRIFGRYYLSSGFALGGIAAVFVPFFFLGLFIGLPVTIALALASPILAGIAMFLMLGIAMFVFMPSWMFLHSYLLVALYGMLNEWNAVPAPAMAEPVFADTAKKTPKKK